MRLIRDQWIEVNEAFARFPVDLEFINVGEVPNDGTGDTMDVAVMKVFRNVIRILEELS